MLQPAQQATEAVSPRKLKQQLLQRYDLLEPTTSGLAQISGYLKNVKHMTRYPGSTALT